MLRCEGVGGVAMGSTGGAGAGAASSRAGSASRGVSAVAPVGLGVKSPEPDSPQPAELSLLRGLLHSLYSTFPPLRPTLRNLIGNFLQRYLRAPSHPQGVSEILQMYAAIIRGVGVPLAAQHRDFLLRHLLPLHQPHAMLNELAPVMQAYHESLVYVLVQFLEKDKEAAAMPQYQQQYYQQQSLCEQILTRLLHGWPNARAANSPKEVLLLHECEKILEFCPTDAPTPASSSGSPSSPPPSAAFHRIMAQFLPYLVQCISSYNHRVAERALQLWQNDRFVSLCQSDRAHILPAILPALLDEKRHWNGSVNKVSRSCGCRTI
jgi:serine/threonine-protein phosphatase 2A regulatory subunit B'